ncbi:hypothetical protein BTVI_20283 [Pitangus sulphuratus]|nr:hypothetical protein BTVI_20283 [Pitangus sulphuratus]
MEAFEEDNEIWGEPKELIECFNNRILKIAGKIQITKRLMQGMKMKAEYINSRVRILLVHGINLYFSAQKIKTSHWFETTVQFGDVICIHT